MKRIFIILLVLVVVAVGYVVATNSNNKNTAKAPEVKNDQLVTDVSIYRNEELGFTLKMPVSAKGYTVTRKNPLVASDPLWKGVVDLDFTLPSKTSPAITIEAVPIANFDNWKHLVCDGAERCPRELGRNAKFVFTIQGYSYYGCDAPNPADCAAENDLVNLPKESFKAI